MAFPHTQSITDLSLIVVSSCNELLYVAIDAYILCYFITSITIAAGSIDGIIYNAPWYQLPRNEQLIVGMIMRRSRLACEIKGMGVFVCSLETYLRVYPAVFFPLIFAMLFVHMTENSGTFMPC